MMKRMLIMLTLLALFFGALFGWKTYVNERLGERSPDQFSPVTISATAARNETWTPALTAVGTLETEKGVNVTAQAPGIITALYFESGIEVGAGDLLVQQFIDDDLARLCETGWCHNWTWIQPKAIWIEFRRSWTPSRSRLTKSRYALHSPDNWAFVEPISVSTFSRATTSSSWSR
jgi:hypothetical protein